MFLVGCVFPEQKQVHFRLRNRQTGLLMTATGDLDDVKLLRIQEMEESDGLEQIWFYHSGHLHCKVPLMLARGVREVSACRRRGE